MQKSSLNEGFIKMLKRLCCLLSLLPPAEPLPAKSGARDPKTENLFIRGLASNSIVVCRCPVFFC